MADLNRDTVLHLSRLCRIAVSDEELPELEESLKKVLNYVDQLQKVDLSDLLPYSRIEEQGIDSLRADEVKDLLPCETFLNNAPDHVGGMIRVPPVIKQQP